MGRPCKIHMITTACSAVKFFVCFATRAHETDGLLGRKGVKPATLASGKGKRIGYGGRKRGGWL